MIAQHKKHIPHIAVDKKMLDYTLYIYQLNDEDLFHIARDSNMISLQHASTVSQVIYGEVQLAGASLEVSPE